MQNKDFLQKKLRQIDNKSYGLYKEIQGEYNFDNYILLIDYVQGDPFASPSRIRIRMSTSRTHIPESCFDKKYKRVALEDFLTRMVDKEIRNNFKGHRGSGKSGLIKIAVGGQEIIERTSVSANKSYVEVRLFMGLPAKGRRILGMQAIDMIFHDIENIMEKSLLYDNFDKTLLMEYINLSQDQYFLREEIEKRGLVAFIANGSVLPRESGISDKPLKGKNVITFSSPESLSVEFNLPNRGSIKGMGIPKGITLIVGGGYHGKSTLLKAIERGIYNHIPEDGREFVVSVKDSMKIRAEDGRSVANVNITPFITNLPFGTSTEQFTTENASGSTSQAANIMEALELGTSLLLLDEDTSATNFMIRDGRMQALVSKDNEPITPFIDKVISLYRDKGVSSILVLGGSGDYFDVADNIIMMENYVPIDVTQKAKEVSNKYKTQRIFEGSQAFGDIPNRIPVKDSFEIQGKSKVKTKGLHKILFGKDMIDLSCLEQLVEVYQTEAIANIIKYIYTKYLDDEKSLFNILENVMKDIDEKGLEVVSSYRSNPPGDLALPRIYEVAGAINRLRRLKVKKDKGTK